MKLPKISLDTNVFIFGLRKIDPFAGIILKYLFQFDVRISAQIFVSENRHFLQKLPKRSFEVIDSMTFCQKFSLK
jgi:hypothetical protein